MKVKTKREVEAKISEAITKLERAKVGRNPEDVKSYIVEDMVIIRLKGVLTAIERELTKHPEGGGLIKRCRVCLRERMQNIFKETIHHLLNVEVNSCYADISTEKGESSLIFTLSENIETRFRGKGR